MAEQLVNHDLIRQQAFGISIPTGEEYDAALDGLAMKAQRRLFAHPKGRTIASRIANGSLDVDLVRDVIVDMVLRIVRNPNAYRSVSIDDFQATIDQAISAGALYPTADELALLAAPVKPARARSMRMYLPRHRLPRA